MLSKKHCRTAFCLITNATEQSIKQRSKLVKFSLPHIYTIKAVPQPSGGTERFTSSRLHSSSLCRSLASVASTCWRCRSLSLSQRCCSCRCWDCSLWKLASSSLCRAIVRCFSCSRRTFPLWRPGREARCSSMWLSHCVMMAWRQRQAQEKYKTRKCEFFKHTEYTTYFSETSVMVIPADCRAFGRASELCQRTITETTQS